jgi:hypothetical protein
VIAVGDAALRFSGLFDRNGVAIVHLPPGRYAITTSDHGACKPVALDLPASVVTRLTLTCVAPS